MAHVSISFQIKILAEPSTDLITKSATRQTALSQNMQLQLHDEVLQLSDNCQANYGYSRSIRATRTMIHRRLCMED